MTTLCVASSPRSTKASRAFRKRDFGSPFKSLTNLTSSPRCPRIHPCGAVYALIPQQEAALGTSRQHWVTHIHARPECSADDLIMICSGCEVLAHRTCYGGVDFKIPDGPWLCQPCKTAPKPAPHELKCELCTLNHPLLFQRAREPGTAPGSRKWCHAVCWESIRAQLPASEIGVWPPRTIPTGLPQHWVW